MGLAKLVDCTQIIVGQSSDVSSNWNLFIRLLQALSDYKLAMKQDY